MPTWGQILNELGVLHREAERQIAAGNLPQPGAPSPFDVVRRKYLAQLHKQTGRAVIVYASSWLENRPGIAEEQLSVDLRDVAGFMEAVSNVEERELDLILHSPGGRAEAAESIVEYLRTRFDHVRIIVPLAAMSAATMIALSGDAIVMGAHSQLGPIDPQFTIFTPEGPRSAPGQAILDQFDLAKSEIAADPGKLGAWLPILRGYLPGLIAQCHHSRELAKQYVANWLERFMFKDDPDRATKARSVAAWFADFSYFRSHGRRVSREDAEAQGVVIERLEGRDDFQDAVLSVYHAVQHTFATGATKIIENHHGRAWISSVNIAALAAPAGAPPSPPLKPPIPTPRKGPPGPPQRRKRR